MRKRVLIVASTTGYQTRVFEEAARRIGLDVTMATDRCHQLEDPWGDQAIAVRFTEPEAGAEILASLDPRPDGIIAVGDRPTVIAAMTAARLGLPFHPPDAVRICRNKFLARERFREAGLPVPGYFQVPLSIDAGEALRCATFPCVLKPQGLSASRGVIRADNEQEFLDAFERISAILREPDVRQARESQDEFIQVETYIPGREFALEGFVQRGQLRTLAIFDKPDPLEGPFFEETIYVTPSREPAGTQQAIIESTGKAVLALRLTDGPIHAEMRVAEDSVYMLEVAARPIGGLCAQTIRFEGAVSLEEFLLRAAAGENVSRIPRENEASGVMMIPIPSSGIYRGVSGTEEARSVAGISDVIITAREGQRLRQLPEGASYLGFLFGRGESPGEVEACIRQAHATLRFTISRELQAFQPES